MKKLHKLFYIELIQNFAVTYFAFFTVAFTIDFFERIDDIVIIKQNIYQIALFFLFRIPYLHSQIALYSLIISCMITLNILSQKNEIVALLSVGINIKRIFIVMLGFVTVINTINFVNDCYFSPKYLFKADTKFNQSSLTSLSGISDIILKTETGFIFIDIIIPRNNTLLNTYIVKINQNDHKLEQVNYAPVVTLENGNWIAKDGKLILFKEKKVNPIKTFELPKIRLLKDIGVISYKPEWLTIKDNFRIIKSGSRSGMDIKSYSYQFAKKIIRFFSPFLLLFTVFPLGFQLGRNKKNVEIIFVGVIILLIYSVFETFLFRITQSVGLNVIISSALLLAPLSLAGIITWKKHFFWKTR